MARSELDTGLSAVDGTGFLRGCWRLISALEFFTKQIAKGAPATGAPFVLNGNKADEAFDWK